MFCKMIHQNTSSSQDSFNFCLSFRSMFKGKSTCSFCHWVCIVSCRLLEDHYTWSVKEAGFFLGQFSFFIQSGSREMDSFPLWSFPKTLSDLKPGIAHPHQPWCSWVSKPKGVWEMFILIIDWDSMQPLHHKTFNSEAKIDPTFP